jgi:hypothetical protein
LKFNRIENSNFGNILSFLLMYFKFTLLYGIPL